jgi:hypothetical protein
MTHRLYPETEHPDRRAKVLHRKWLQGRKLNPEEQLRARLKSSNDDSVLSAAMTGAVAAVVIVRLYLPLALVGTHL